MGPVHPGVHPAVQQGREEIVVDPFQGHLHVEAVDATSYGAGLPLELRRIHRDDGWRFGFDTRIEVTQSSLVLHSLEETRTISSETTPEGLEAGAVISEQGLRAERTRNGWTLSDENLTLAFSEDGRLLSRSTQGSTHTHVWENGLLHEIRVQDGRALTLLRDSNGQLTVARMPDGREVYYEYRGDLLLAVDADDRPRSRYVYDTSNRLKAILWPDASQVRFQRDGEGRISAIQGPGSSSLSLSWTDKTLSVQNGTGAMTRISTLEGGYRVTGPLGRAVSVQANTYGITGWTDPRGLETLIQRTADGQPAGVSAPGGEQWKLDWRGPAAVSVQDPGGGRWRLDRDSNNQIVAITDPDSRTTRILRTDTGAIRAIESGSAPLRLGRDGQGRLTSIQSPTGAATQIDRNGTGLVTRVADASGNAITLTGHYNGTPTALVERDGGTWSVERDLLGRISRIDTPSGGNLQIQRDRSGRPVVLKNRSGAQTSYSWDSNGRLTRIQDPLGGTWNLLYDSSDRLSQLRRPDGSQLVLTWSATSELIRVAHSGTPHELRRDLRGNPLAVGPLQWKWDASDHWLEASAPAISLTLARSGAGAVRGIQIGTDPMLAVGRDASGRVTSLGAGDDRWILVRDPAGRLVGLGQGQDMVRMDRDERGLPTQLRAGDMETRILRDAVGRPLKWTSSDGTSLSTDRDEQGRAILLRFPDGSLTRVSHGDRRLELTLADKNGTLLLERRVEWNQGGQITQMAETGLRDTITTISRTEIGDPIAMEQGDFQWTWLPDRIEGGGSLVRLDSDGRPLEATPPIGPTAWGVSRDRLVYLFDEKHRMEGIVGEAQHLFLEHDDLGRLVAVTRGEHPGWNIEWDPLGWPSRIADPSGLTTRLLHDGHQLLGWQQGEQAVGLLSDLELGMVATGDTPWFLMTDEQGQTRIEQAEGQPPLGVAHSPLGFPDRPLLTPLSALGAWNLFAGGPQLDGSGATDPVSGQNTAGTWQPPWWHQSPQEFAFPQLDSASQPWWAPDPFRASGPFARPLQIFLSIEQLEPFLSTPLWSLHPAAPPVGWLPQSAATPRHPWTASTDQVPLQDRGLAAVAVSAALSPSHPVALDDVLQELLSSEFQALPPIHTLTGQNWRWWLMGLDTLMNGPQLAGD